MFIVTELLRCKGGGDLEGICYTIIDKSCIIHRFMAFNRYCGFFREGLMKDTSKYIGFTTKPIGLMVS